MTSEGASPESTSDDELLFPEESQDTRIRDMSGDLYQQQPLIETGTSNADGNGEGSSCPTANGLGSADEGDEGSLPQTIQLPSSNMKMTRLEVAILTHDDMHWGHVPCRPRLHCDGG